MSPSLEFECGTVIKSVGVVSMVIASHLKICKVPACIEDCKQELKKRGDN